MQRSELTCLFFPEVSSWEKDGFRPILRSLSENHLIREVELKSRRFSSLAQVADSDSFWVVARDWYTALRSLRRYVDVRRQRMFLSVLGLNTKTSSLATLFLERFNQKLPPSVQVIAHSPLNYRFFKEFEKVPQGKLSFLHLPYPSELAVQMREQRKSNGRLTVGTFSSFTTESNLNYLLNVIHYVVQKKPDTSFKIVGSGMLENHLNRMIVELGLNQSVEIEKTSSAEAIAELDVFLYLPLRNDHFLPLLMAAARGNAVLATEMSGIEEFVVDGHTGFVVPVNETKPMGELVIRLLDHEILRKAIGEELKKSLSLKFSEFELTPKYEALFFRAQSHRLQAAA